MVHPTHQQNDLKIEHFVFNADAKHSALLQLLCTLKSDLIRQQKETGS
jgi:hypothetical protein